MAQLANLDYLDKKTLAIVSQFIRNAQKEIRESLRYSITNEINSAILAYVDDHFMIYRGSHEWVIKEPKELSLIKSAQATQKFTSDIFEISKLQWIAIIYPNGDKANTTNQFRFFVQLCSMPSFCNNIVARLTLECRELQTKNIFIASFLKKNSINKTIHGWCDDTLSFNEFINENPDKLSFTVKIKILQIVGKDPAKSYGQMLKYQSSVIDPRNMYKIKWIVRPKEICEQSSHWLANKRIYSDIVGDMFACYYIPSQSKMVLAITSSSKQNITAVQVKWTLFIPEIDIKYSIIAKLTSYSYKKSTQKNTCSLLIPSLIFNDFKEYSYISFLSEIEILNEYDAKENVIGMSAEDEWTSYLQTKPKKEKISKRPMRKSPARVDAVLPPPLPKPPSIQTKEQKKEIAAAPLPSNKALTEKQKQRIEDVRVWLRETVGLEQYFDVFVKNGYDSLAAMSTIQSVHLKKIGIKLIGHRQQILKYAALLNEKNKNQNMTNKTLIVVAMVFAFVLIIGKRK